MPHRRRTTYPYRRRIIYPWWLKVLVRTWGQQGLTCGQIKARLADFGLNISCATIATWLATPRLSNTHV